MSVSRMDWDLSIRLAIKSGIEEILYFFQKKLHLSVENTITNKYLTKIIRYILTSLSQITEKLNI